MVQLFRGDFTMATMTTSRKGQVVIPKREREAVGIKPGSKVVVKAVNDPIEIRPSPDNPVEYFCGFFKEGTSLTKALIKTRKRELKRKG
jgi:AbrB family looped-hinge helix DNA binding protein